MQSHASGIVAYTEGKCKENLLQSGESCNETCHEAQERHCHDIDNTKIFLFFFNRFLKFSYTTEKEVLFSVI